MTEAKKKNRPRGLSYKPSSNTGFKGVSEIANPAAVNKFHAQIAMKNKAGKQTTFHIGHFATAEDAHYERLKFLLKLS